jgi:hypothetical protein
MIITAIIDMTKSSIPSCLGKTQKRELAFVAACKERVPVMGQGGCRPTHTCSQTVAATAVCGCQLPPAV